jgi:quercetin dioxygenase-like cupin family protein
MKNSILILLSFALCISITNNSLAQNKKMSETKEVVLIPYESIQWAPIGEEFPGVEVAPLRGDMTKGAYALYVKLPANFSFPLHYHGNTEWGIILSGTLVLGDKNGKETTLTAGSYVYYPKGNLHSIKAGPEGCVFLEESNEKESTVMAGDKK